ncbi:hypothetical protein [Collimonas humicola]|uniref:hypothetical protein n=1 Tax=Collimonas humicola TaxID=2825886 RepID=UPI001B8D0AD1|nr:hypothetical protein [Collimonas humicola]
MKLSPLLLGLVVTPVFAAGGFSGGQSVQSRASYEAAIHNSSTSPSYVLITVVEARTESARSICTTANLLIGAINMEYGLGHDRAGYSKSDEIALSNQTHVFRFTKQDALNNVPFTYSDDDIAAARTFLAPFSVAELRDKFSSLYSSQRLALNGFSRDAIACVLIERGLSPKMADISGQVFVERLSLPSLWKTDLENPE